MFLSVNVLRFLRSVFSLMCCEMCDVFEMLNKNFIYGRKLRVRRRMKININRFFYCIVKI